MKFLLYCISIFSFFLPLYAQQIEFKLGVSSYGYSNTFDNRYQGPLYEDYTLNATTFYRAKKVKSMSIYQVNKKLYRYWEFDTAGVIIKTGQQNYYYTEYTSKQVGPDRAVSVTCYYASFGGPLLRCDSVYRNYTRYTFGDTVVAWTNYRIIVHKTGALINEQNKYYNAHFYNKKIVFNDRSPIWGFRDENGKPIAEVPGGQVLIHKELKTNYEPEQLYKCSVVNTDESFYSSCNNGHKDLKMMQVLHCPLVKNFGKNNKRDYLTDGEWFQEPDLDYQEPMHCGNNNERRNEPWLAYSADINGLYDTCYVMQLVLDTSPEALRKYEKQKEEAIKNGAVVVEGYDSGPYQEKPYKQVLYYFRYGYF